MSSTAAQPNVLDRFTFHYIRSTARRMVARKFFDRNQLPDLIQDLTVALLEHQGAFDPEKGRWTTFVRMVVSRAAISACRANTAASRTTDSPIVSYNVLVIEEEEVPAQMCQSLEESTNLSKCHQERRDRQEEMEFALDVAEVIKQLPEELQAVCRKLQEKTLAEVARELNLPRSTLISRLQKVREHFQAAGLDQYI